MSTEITIFEIPEKEIAVNKSQKEIEYDDLKRDSKLEAHHFDMFYEMDIKAEEHMTPKSNIVSILCKYVIKYCMPVVLADSKKYSITLQNEQLISIYDAANKRSKVVPENTQFAVSGVRIPILFARSYDTHMLSGFDHVVNQDLANTGQYGLRDHQTQRFTQQRPGFTQPGLPHMDTTKNNVVYFKSENDAVEKLTTLINYIKFMEKYYGENYMTLVADMSVPPYTPEFENDGRRTWMIKRDIATGALIKALTSSIEGTIGDSFNHDLFLTLQQNNLLHAYHLGNTVGVDDKLFKREISEQLEKIQFQKDYVEQRKFGFALRLELAKKQSIAYNKYGESNLTKLDKKQLAVIELEYTKLSKFLNKNQSLAAKQNQKLFFRLRKSFLDVTDDRLKTALEAIRKEISNKELTGNVLIDGGVCPHVYQRGVTNLKYFGKPWLNTQLEKDVVQRYSLPEDHRGHFCYICGEMLADADTEGEVRFVGGERVVHSQIDDPLQTMIWKEAMYIVSTYIKFNTPIPIKPLVSSIAKGLRNVVGEQEAKLFRSKTTTADSAKDTLNLYSCIYVYAVLCGMMITNPNKMLFGRDKPDTNRQKPKKYDKPKKVDKPTIQEQSEYVEANAKIDVGDKPTKENLASKIGISDYVKPELSTATSQAAVGASEERLAARRRRRERKRKTRKYRGGKTTKDIKLYERFILTTALNLILVTKDSIIKRLTYINVDVIKQIFLKTAYPWAKRYSKPIKVSENSENQLAVSTQNIVDTDPFYQYLYYAKRLACNSNVEKHCPKSMGAVKDILGRSIEKIADDMKESINLYTTIKAPKKWDFGDKLYDDYTYRSFETSLMYLEREIYLKPFVPRHMQVVQYYEDTKDVLEQEKQYHLRLARQVLRPMFEFELLNDIQGDLGDFRPDKLDLAKHYCSNGHQHVPGSFIYKTKGGKEVELTNKEINGWISDKNLSKLAELTTMKLIDEKCKLCKKHIRSSTSDKTSGKSLENIFAKLDDIIAFYQYYTTRCPEGDLHDIKNNVCAKCKIKTDIPHDTEDAYYKKHISKFKKIEREKQALSLQSLKQAHEENDESRKYASTVVLNKTANYKFTQQKIAEWSQLAGVKYNILANIGLTEGVAMEDIQSSRINPSKTELSPGAYMTQSIKIKNYILQILRDYNMLMNHENIVGLPLYLKEILTAQKKVDIKGLHKSMPQVTDAFMVLDNKYKYTLKPKLYANFLLEYLAGIMVEIDQVSTKQYKLMAKMLIQHFTKNIMTQDVLFSKAESIFSKKNKGVTEQEDNLTDEAVSGDEYAGYRTDESIGEFSDDKTEHYKNEITNFADAYDVENAADVWDID